MFIGKNKDFKVAWNFSKQMYTVWYKNSILRIAYSWKDIQSYLN